MVSRHLGLAHRRSRRRTGIANTGPGRDDIARLDKRIAYPIITGQHALATDARERIDIELVVGKDDKVLEVLRIGSGVVVEPMQRIIHAGSAEHGERLPRAGRQRAIDNRVVDRA
jgi:hypothetical protein